MKQNEFKNIKPEARKRDKEAPMAKNEFKIPEKFRDIVEPILLKEEKILCAFQESFRFFGDSILPKWAILTNLRLIMVRREFPGLRMDEYYLDGMTVELFQVKLGFYNTIDFLLNNKSVEQLVVAHKRWEEAEDFVAEVSKNIGQIQFELRSESTEEKKESEDQGQLEK